MIENELCQRSKASNIGWKWSFKCSSEIQPLQLSLLAVLGAVNLLMQDGVAQSTAQWCQGSLQIDLHNTKISNFVDLPTSTGMVSSLQHLRFSCLSTVYMKTFREEGARQEALFYCLILKSVITEF